VVAESLACGTPVAGLARGALPELVDSRHARLVPSAGRPDDAVVAELAVALQQAVDLDRDACRAHAVLTCSVDVMVDRYELLYADPAAHLAGRAA
jgi:glycosyltransferase involved in cell wall biosynthesis